MVNKVKNGPKRLTTVKIGQYGQNWFLKKSEQSTTVKNGQILSKTVKNGQNWSKRSKIIKYGQKRSKLSKMIKNGQ